MPNITIDEKDLLQFVSSAPTKTPRGRVTAYSMVFGYFTYEIPAGFQYDRFLSNRFPTYTVFLKGTDYGWKAEILDKDKKLLECHRCISYIS